MKPLRLPALLAGSFLLIYLLTLTQVHTYDALSYILDVDRKPWRELFHPHHLAYGPLGALIRAAAISLGWQDSAAVLLQAANAIAGALGVGLFAWLAERELRRIGAHPPGYSALLAAAGAILLGGTYAFWYYAIEVEVYTIAALFLIAALGMLLEASRRPRYGLALALGATQGLAVLFHQTNVLLSVPALLALWFGVYRQAPAGETQAPDARHVRFTKLAASYGLPLAVIVGAGYLGVGLGISGFRSWGELFGWAAGYATTGWWGGAVDTSNLGALGSGLADTFAATGGRWIGLALLGMLGVHWRGIRRLPDATLAVLLSWLLVYGGFFLWWEPENIEFWIASLPPAGMILVLGIAGAPGGNRQRWAAPAVLALLGVITLGLNGPAIAQRGDPTRDLQRVLAEATAALTAPGDLIVAADGLQELYLPYYTERNQIISLNQAMTASNLEWPIACELLQARVTAALESGYAVVMSADALLPPPAPPGEPPTPIERFGLAAETVQACYAPFLGMAEPVTLGPGLPTAQRIPAAQELADGRGWDFRRGVWGWRAANAAAAGVDPARGWMLTPEVDPFVSSPPLTIDPARHRTLELRLAATSAARDAQIFFLDAAGQADETRSIRFTLLPGAAAQTYRFALTDVLQPDEVLTGLRIDPVGVGDGSMVAVEWVRLGR